MSFKFKSSIRYFFSYDVIKFIRMEVWMRFITNATLRSFEHRNINTNNPIKNSAEAINDKFLQKSDDVKSFVVGYILIKCGPMENSDPTAIFHIYTWCKQMAMLNDGQYHRSRTDRQGSKLVSLHNEYKSSTFNTLKKRPHTFLKFYFMLVINYFVLINDKR